MFDFDSYIVFKEHLNIFSIHIVNSLLYELFPFVFVCLNNIMFGCIIWQNCSNVIG